MRTRILITSCGSLVAQGIAASLDGRRDGLELIGANAVDDAQARSTCDRLHRLPRTAQIDAFESAFRALFDTEQPDLVIPARDDDVVALTRLAAEWPALRVRLLAGTARMARIIRDKYRSSLWAASRKLTFASTIRTGRSDTAVRAHRIVTASGFPLIAKPRCGNASRGVRIVDGQRHLHAFISEPGYVLQPFIGNGEAFRELDRELQNGIPLFWRDGETRNLSGQALIGPDGTVLCVIATRNDMVMGRCEGVELCTDAASRELLLMAARAAAQDGWRGPLNLQCAQRSDGAWVCYEMNGRFTGATSARRYMGCDEVALAIEAFTGASLPPVEPGVRVGRVERVFRDLPVYHPISLSE